MRPHRFESSPDGLSARENREWRISRSHLSIVVIRAALSLVSAIKKKRVLVSFGVTKKKLPGRKWKAAARRRSLCSTIPEQILKLHRLVRESLEGSCHTRGTGAEYRAEPSRKGHFSNFAARTLSFPLYCADRHVSASCTSTARQIESQNCTTSAREEVIHCGASKLLANAVLQLMPCC